MARPRGVASIIRHKTVVLPAYLRSTQRFSSTSEPSPPDSQTSPPSSQTGSVSPRWLSEVKQRIGRCVTFGLKPAQVQEAGGILQEVARDWRELLAGSEGFLTGPHRRGLFRHRVVWGDSDSMGHTNNVLYNRYAESGRVEWAHNYGRYIDPKNAEAWMGLLRPTDTGLILRKIVTEFKFPMQYPDRISVYHKLGVEPTDDTDAFHFDVLILSERHQRPAARLIEDCVVYDYTKGKKTKFKPFMIEVLRETWRLQQEAKHMNSERLLRLLDRVTKLEKESWDREDAVEDMGSQANQT